MLARSRLLRAPRMSLLVTMVSLLLYGFGQSEVPAAEITLSWKYDAPGAAGFMLYFGFASRNYVNRVDVGNVNTYTVKGLAEGATYFCTVTAYDPAKVESGYSNEIILDIPSTSKE
jgi:hypothetical protein